ncbi:MAG: CoA transferase [Acidimicrobiales bacterium]|nr:CoA transferase [Acidimicrobiales bacterium]
MSDVLQGIKVVDLSRGSAGPIATMLLADGGADVTRVVRPGPDDLATSASKVWDRGKHQVTADLRVAEDRERVLALIADADVLVDSFAPSTLEKLGLGPEATAGFSRLVHCSITGYGTEGPLRDRPGYDCLVQARTGMMYEQPGHRPGPIFHWSPLPSYGAGLLAACGIMAALREREISGLGQKVDTSLAQGVLAWTTMPWTRVERPNPGYYSIYGCRDVSPTPSYEAGDGRWVHPMPEVVPLMLKTLGLDASHLAGAQAGSCAERKAWQGSVQEMFRRKPAQEWLQLFWDNDVRCQPVLSVSESYDHPQIRAIGAVEECKTESGRARQFGRAFTVTRQPGRTPERGDPTGERLSSPLEGIRVLDFGLAVAGPYGPMLLSDLGADVIRVDNVNAPRATDNQVWAACQRGKRSITLDLKSAEGKEVVSRLISQADVIHHNMRPGVAERLGIGYEDVRAVNPGIVYCHVTGFGPVGPLASFPGCDQMSQALSGLEHEQGATAAGGHPTWNRLGMCDHATAILSVLGVLEGLQRRERTGESSLVEASISGAAAFLASHVGEAEDGSRFPSLDREQTGLGPLYRLYQTADGWICVAAIKPDHWPALCRALDLDDLVSDPRFADRPARHRNAGQLAARLSERFATRSGAEWAAILDQAGVPAELASADFIESWYDEPSLVSRGWVTKYTHALWGRTEQLGRLWHFEATPSRLAGPPVIHGQHSEEILFELGYSSEEVARLSESGVTTLWRQPESGSDPDSDRTRKAAI